MIGQFKCHIYFKLKIFLFLTFLIVIQVTLKALILFLCKVNFFGLSMIIFEILIIISKTLALNVLFQTFLLKKIKLKVIFQPVIIQSCEMRYLNSKVRLFSTIISICHWVDDSLVLYPIVLYTQIPIFQLSSHII